MAKRATINCGNRILGFVDISTVENWHIYGSFTPGSDFAFYEDAIIAVRTLQHEAESNPEVDWTDALEIVNGYGFSLANDDGTHKPICDFQLDDDGVAEFKFEL